MSLVCKNKKINNFKFMKYLQSADNLEINFLCKNCQTCGRYALYCDIAEKLMSYREKSL